MVRRCILLHWFDQSLIEALMRDSSVIHNSAIEIYEHIISLPFIESLPWGVAFHNLTREGLLKSYALSQSELLRTAAKLAAPTY